MKEKLDNVKNQQNWEIDRLTKKKKERGITVLKSRMKDEALLPNSQKQKIIKKLPKNKAQTQLTLFLNSNKHLNY